MPNSPTSFSCRSTWQRFTTTMHHRSHPAWYFVPVLALGVAPWLLVAVAAWPAALRRPGPGFSAPLFLALWVLVVFVFFSAVGLEAAGLHPSARARAGGARRRFPGARAARRLLVAQSTLVALAGLRTAAASPALLRIGSDRFDHFASAASGALLARGGRAGGRRRAGAVFALRGRMPRVRRRGRPRRVRRRTDGIVGHRVYAPLFSADEHHRRDESPAFAETPFFAVDSYDHSVPWSLRRTVTMVGYRDELGEAVHWEPGRLHPRRRRLRRAGPPRARPMRSSRCAISTSSAPASACRWRSPRAGRATLS